MEQRARGSAPRTHRGGRLFRPIAALLIAGIVGFVLGTMPDWLMSDPGSPFIGELQGLVVACITLAVVSAVSGFRRIASAGDPVRATAALICLFLVLTVAFTLGWVGITEYLLTWVGPIGVIVGVGIIAGAVAGGLRRRQG